MTTDFLTRPEIMNRWVRAQALVSYVERQFERVPGFNLSLPGKDEAEVLEHPSFDLARRILLSKHLTRVRDLQA
jgi:hypothetical protein